MAACPAWSTFLEVSKGWSHTLPLSDANHHIHHASAKDPLDDSKSNGGQHHALGNVMHWVFWFLHAGEFTVPFPSEYDSEVHLNLSDMAIDDHHNPSMIHLCFKQCKTDPFRQGIQIFLGKTGVEVCPVRAVIQCIGVRRPDPGSYLARGYLSRAPF